MSRPDTRRTTSSDPAKLLEQHQRFQQAEEKYTDSAGRFIRADKPNKDRSIIAAVQTMERCTNEYSTLLDISPVYVEQVVLAQMEASVRIQGSQARDRGPGCTVAAATTSDRATALTPEKLAMLWGIGLRTAQNTLQATTQRVIRKTANAALSRRFL